MLENSGLVLGVDSSLGLLTRLHNPRDVGVTLLVHGRLLHLTGGEGTPQTGSTHSPRFQSQSVGMKQSGGGGGGRQS